MCQALENISVNNLFRLHCNLIKGTQSDNNENGETILQGEEVAGPFVGGEASMLEKGTSRSSSFIMDCV